MTDLVFGWWWTRLAALGLAVVLGASAACGGEESTPTPAATVVTVSPTATPTPTSVATVPATIQPTLIPTPSLAPTQTATATPLPRPSTPSAPAPLPEAANLILEVTSPPEDSVFASTLVTVAGLTSPDATVSVNGILATPDPRGRFSVDLILSPVKNPMHIEIIATSVAGEQRSLVRTVVYLP